MTISFIALMGGCSHISRPLSSSQIVFIHYRQMTVGISVLFLHMVLVGDFIMEMRKSKVVRKIK